MHLKSGTEISEIRESISTDEDEEDDGSTEVNFTQISLGDLVIHCPECEELTDVVLVGLGMHEQEGEETFDLLSLGAVAYPCGHIFLSPCLSVRVGQILNGYEDGFIHLGLLDELTYCEEHGEDE